MFLKFLLTPKFWRVWTKTGHFMATNSRPQGSKMQHSKQHLIPAEVPTSSRLPQCRVFDLAVLFSYQACLHCPRRQCLAHSLKEVCKLQVVISRTLLCEMLSEHFMVLWVTQVYSGVDLITFGPHKAQLVGFWCSSCHLRILEDWQRAIRTGGML